MDYLGLRDYQCAAIQAVEAALADEQRRLLLAMATGTGKTRTALGLIYRLIKTKRFRRVLFLVDRTSLGDQAQVAFANAKLEHLQSFNDIYDVKRLDDLQPDKDTKLHFATVQGMMRRILNPSDTDTMPSVGQYDCIVVDECHRGYNLDKELSDEELTFRSQEEYMSKYRRVLEYFDAVAIGLTATPALHTTEIFGPPVFTYSYRDASSSCAGSTAGSSRADARPGHPPLRRHRQGVLSDLRLRASYRRLGRLFKSLSL